MGAKILNASLSCLELPVEQTLRRLPKAPNRHRPQKFWDNFEDRVLVYDIFWHLDGRQVLLVCPPAVNLKPQWDRATFTALPSGKALSANFHALRATMTVALKDVPAGSTQIKIDFAGHEFISPIMENMATEFDGSCVMFTMNQNNPLQWIEEWTRYHQKIHEVDAIVIFDNGSTQYGPDEVAKCIASVAGIKKVLVVPMPQKYGPHDPALLFNRFWANFLQVSSFSILLRRFCGKAFGLLNVDIDELAAPIPQSDVFEMAHESIDGFCSLKGGWVESILLGHDRAQELPLHTDFRIARRDFTRELNAKKWMLDPTRDWVKNLDIHPSTHRIKNMPKHMAKRAPESKFWHFKGINNNWKEDRNQPKKFNTWFHYRPPELQALFDAYKKATNSKT